MAQLLLEGIYRIDKTLVDVTAVGPRRVLAADRGVPVGVQLIVLDPVDPFAPANIARHAAVWPGFRSRCQRRCADARIQVNVAAQRPVISGIFDEEGFVPSLVQMTSSLIAFGVPIRVPGEPMLHPSSQVGLGSLNERMDMIGHPAIGEHDPATAIDFLPKSVGEAFVVTVVVKQFSPAITTSDDVVVGACKLDAWKPRQDDCRSVNVQNPKLISH